MTNEGFIRQAYAVAEVKDIASWVRMLQPRRRVRRRVGWSDLTGMRMDAPCCDVVRLKDGKIQLFDCYPSGTVILGQLGVLGNLDGVLLQHASV